MKGKLHRNLIFTPFLSSYFPTRIKANNSIIFFIFLSSFLLQNPQLSQLRILFMQKYTKRQTHQRLPFG